MSKLATAIAATLLLSACVATPEPEAPPPPEEAEITKCDEWIAWLVDGNGPPPSPFAYIRVTVLVLQSIAQECLGRAPHQFEQPPLPIVPEPAPTAAPKIDV